jgi:UDP-hydrolysing UDP-N-acetyl-D-glucosamine 2-epimerase
MMNNSSSDDRKKICVITTTRADYGLLYWPMKYIQAETRFILQTIVSGSHLSAEHGNTHQQITADGFHIDERVDMKLSDDTAVGITRSLALAVAGFGEALARLQPDCLLVLGDRYELLAPVQAALIARIPVAHIAGGDSTEGAFDEAIRHAVSKMSHIHFATNEEAAGRLRQLGENPHSIHVTGSPGLDYIRRLQPLSRAELEKRLQRQFNCKNLLVTYHPETLAENATDTDFASVLEALAALGGDVGIFFTRPNQDPAGQLLSTMIDDFVAKHANACVFASMGQDVYLSMINEVDSVVGNSSSGLYEVPSFKKPTVNVGDRQKGRLFASSVINCRPAHTEVLNAIQKAFELDCSATVNPNAL